MPEELIIVVPMAGRGSRFAVAGFEDPKPLIKVDGIPMIRLVIDNIRPLRPHRFVFVCQREHVEHYGLAQSLSKWAPGCSVIQIDGVTEGAACTVLEAATEISDAPLMIANSDQYIDTKIDDYLSALDDEYDGLIMTMSANDPKWSYISLDENGTVDRVVEKQVISGEATVGIYNFRRGSDFVRAAECMIRANKRVNGEFYVAPVYNELISDGGRITYRNIGSEMAGMYGLGIPSDLEAFLNNPVSKRATRRFHGNH